MNLDQALRVCFLPAALIPLLLSGTVCVISCGVIQATQGSPHQPVHPECPQLIVPGMWELMEAVHTTCAAAPTWHQTLLSVQSGSSDASSAGTLQGILASHGRSPLRQLIG